MLAQAAAITSPLQLQQVGLTLEDLREGVEGAVEVLLGLLEHRCVVVVWGAGAGGGVGGQVGTGYVWVVAPG